MVVQTWISLEIVSDNGKESCTEIVDTLLKLMRINKTNATPYHPQTNAQVEVCNKTIAACLKTQVLSSRLDWAQYVFLMMFADNTICHRSIKTAPLQVVWI
jgi:hypothetical protein